MSPTNRLKPAVTSRHFEWPAYGSKRIKYRNEICEIHKSVQSVIQTIYDIIKAHGGELKVETKEGEGSEFVIQLLTV